MQLWPELQTANRTKFLVPWTALVFCSDCQQNIRLKDQAVDWRPQTLKGKKRLSLACSTAAPDGAVLDDGRGWIKLLGGPRFWDSLEIFKQADFVIFPWWKLFRGFSKPARTYYPIGPGWTYWTKTKPKLSKWKWQSRPHIFPQEADLLQDLLSSFCIWAVAIIQLTEKD